MEDRLVLFGGDPAVTAPHPHFQWPQLGPDEFAAVAEQLATGEISIAGRAGVIRRFEDEFAEYHGSRFSLATNSGTAALLSAFVGCGLGPGDDVLAPVYTFHATVSPLLAAGARPILVDAEPHTGNIDPARLASAWTPSTKAIVVTHMWGHPCEMDSIVSFAHERGLKVIEDCSHAHGSRYRSRLVGTFGDVGVFSLQANKIIPAGEGGILITDSREIYERATLLGHYGERARAEVLMPAYSPFADTGLGFKFRMHPLAAALALIGLHKLDERIEARATNLGRLSNLLSGVRGIEPPLTLPHVTRGGFYGYKPLLRPEELGDVTIERYLDALAAEGVEVHRSKSPLLADLPLFREGHQFRNIQGRETSLLGAFPNAEHHHSRAVGLPTFTQPHDAQIVEQYGMAFAKVGKQIAALGQDGPWRSRRCKIRTLG